MDALISLGRGKSLQLRCQVMPGNDVFPACTTQPVYCGSGAGSTLEIFGQHQNAHHASSSVSATPTKASFVTSGALWLILPAVESSTLFRNRLSCADRDRARCITKLGWTGKGPKLRWRHPWPDSSQLPRKTWHDARHPCPGKMTRCSLAGKILQTQSTQSVLWSFNSITSSPPALAA